MYFLLSELFYPFRVRFLKYMAFLKYVGIIHTSKLSPFVKNKSNLSFNTLISTLLCKSTTVIPAIKPAFLGYGTNA